MPIELMVLMKCLGLKEVGCSLSFKRLSSQGRAKNGPSLPLPGCGLMRR